MFPVSQSQSLIRCPICCSTIHQVDGLQNFHKVMFVQLQLGLVFQISSNNTSFRPISCCNSRLCLEKITWTNCKSPKFRHEKRGDFRVSSQFDFVLIATIPLHIEAEME